MKIKVYGSRRRLSSMWKNRNGSSKKDSTPSKGASQNLESVLEDDENIKMNIIGNDETWSVGATNESTIEKLKLMALSHFFNSTDSHKLAPKYRLISVAEKRPLPNTSTLYQEGLKNNGEFK